MLIEFSVGNFLSFKDKVTFSMLASGITQHTQTNVFDSGKYKLLKSAAIYGANASGKSNFVKALYFLKRYIKSIENRSPDNGTGVIPFLLNTDTINNPSYFQIIFQVEESIYRYGFELDRNKIHSEWLYQVFKTTEKRLFSRNFQNIEITSKFQEGRYLEEKTRDNVLFLTVVAQFNGKISKSILKWFKHLQVMSGLDDSGFLNFTLEQIQKNDIKVKIENFISHFNLGFERFEIINSMKNENTDIEDETTSTNNKIITLHDVYSDENQNQNHVGFILDKMESDGTKKIFSMSGPLIDTFESTKIVVIDELDSRLHPILTKKIIELFHSDINKYNSQLIFATHDTNLLDKDILRRDQIWFTEKDSYGATDLYSLVEFNMDNGKKVRNDASYEKDYILGKYGAIPYIGDFTNLSDKKK